MLEFLVPILIGAGILLVLLLVFLGYVKAPPDTAYIVSGLRRRLVIGKAAIRIPILERLDKLSLKLIPVDVKTSTAVPTADYINIQVDAAVNVKISIEPQRLEIAAQNFLNQPVDYIRVVAKEVLEGNMREIVGRMRLEEMVSDRQKFADLVKENAAPDLAAMGLDIISFNVQNFADNNGVIDDLGIDNISQIKKNAAIAKAQAEKEIAISKSEADKQANDARVAAEREIALKNNELEIQLADLKRQADIKKAEADAAYGIQEQLQRKTVEIATQEASIAKQEKEVLLQQKIAEVAEQALNAEVRKKADAELYRRQKQAEAEKFEYERGAEAKRFAKEQEAESIRTMENTEAEAKRFAKEQEAEAIRTMGNAEADARRFAKEQEAEAIRMTGNAEADARRFAKEQEADAIRMTGNAEADARRFAKEKEAEAERFAKEQEADAQRFAKEKEADAIRMIGNAEADVRRFAKEQEADAIRIIGTAEADVRRFAKEQEAEAIRIIGNAEAEAIRKKGLAEAEAMEKRAEAYSKYNNAAMAEMLITVLPSIAGEIAKPLTQIDKITIISGNSDNSSGISSVADSVPTVMAKLFESMKETVGIDLGEIMRADTYDAKVNRNISISGLPENILPIQNTSGNAEEKSEDTEDSEQ